ncbi:DUF2877 domain-containing protein [Mycobacterium sp. 21AC1]|uniref:oxamate carbamoyltransferase subunit AllH family protein n=1 Tax=[Mycobacterium] appelbergii TaxID=2939269 RepID=UPI00293944A5|nr:DUF2877 domain-containing protein [Mycobacterium sp. 21AC1]MDV3124906.1 DUF2877 domain-containing protein [Mycobacterium sp. 21AC1]
MELARARMADETWLPFLTGQFGDAVVDSTYRHAVNIRLASGDLLWVAADGATLVPNALLTDAVDFAPIRAGQVVRATGADDLALGTVTIDLQGCHTFSCRVAAYDPVPTQVRIGLESAARVLDRHAVAGGLFSRTQTAVDVLGKAIHARLLTGAAGLQASVAAQDLTVAVASARAMIGLGIGSTPSGDDYLLGCLAVLFLHVRMRRFGRELARGLRPWCDDTTPVSRSYLLAACDGRFHVDLTTAITAIFLGKEDRIRGAVLRVIALGATSGTDSTVGVLDTVKTLVAQSPTESVPVSTARPTPRA